MDYRKKIRLIASFSFFVGGGFMLLLYYLLDTPFWEWCNGSSFCNTLFLDEGIGQPLFFFSLSLLPTLILLYFLREEVFRSWFRFTKWYLSFAAIAIFLSLGSHGGWGVGNIFSTELVTMWSAGFFFLISLFLIVIKSWKLRKIPTA